MSLCMDSEWQPPRNISKRMVLLHGSLPMEVIGSLKFGRGSDRKSSIPKRISSHWDNSSQSYTAHQQPGMTRGGKNCVMRTRICVMSQMDHICGGITLVGQA
mmetsp:Transcript_36843/g.60660  ORF Transcript_36843/g.60660 Transcript_36843/m.60660 type:complete len:102 (+) Transcript_36843:274-579(+)